MKSKIVAGVLGILLGGLGAHKFYLGKIGRGILCILFSWTGIPCIVGVIEGIIYLVSDEKTFLTKYCSMHPDDLPKDVNTYTDVESKTENDSANGDESVDEIKD